MTDKMIAERANTLRDAALIAVKEWNFDLARQNAGLAGRLEAMVDKAFHWEAEGLIPPYISEQEYLREMDNQEKASKQIRSRRALVGWTNDHGTDGNVYWTPDLLPATVRAEWLAREAGQ